MANSYVRSQRERINRLRERIKQAETLEQLRNALLGLLDLLEDEL